ncbi:exonuclease domain-containing protein [Mannheimia sp. USDA-ARS-USMARC-1261]|uniref:exonuclease domain-containing protein n=1 Tax=Mannheimia sp. USDA-ARS-USMARC-1261 TaxID=1432056 RepID=UPI00046D5083|nr:exonuclease domain-containing protein [Mannheimia sp. USDA-ARS-USMARC-1261]
MNKFIVIDIETANPDLLSICQVGIVFFENGRIVTKWETLVNPQDYFDPINVCVHGITPQDVEDAPLLSEVIPIIKEFFSNNTICSYGAFDKAAMMRILPTLPNQWLDIMRVARRCWSDKFAEKGYGLANVSNFLKIEQKHHHNALDDAIVAGHILNRALSESNEDLDYWLDRIKKPLHLEYDENGNILPKIKRQGNPDGPLYGEVIVFTGELSMPRQTAAEKAASVGCDVVDGVSKKVTLLVKGIQDKSRLAGKKLSNKEIKAKDLISKGHIIKIISEDDFLKMIGES